MIANFKIKSFKSDCALSSVQEVNAEEFEDKEWTFVIEGVCIIYFIIYV